MQLCWTQHLAPMKSSSQLTAVKTCPTYTLSKLKQITDVNKKSTRASLWVMSMEVLEVFDSVFLKTKAQL